MNHSIHNSQVMTSQEELAGGDTVKAHLLKAHLLTKQGKTEEPLKIYISITGNESDNREKVQWWLTANMKRTPTGEDHALNYILKGIKAKAFADLQKVLPE